MNALNILSGLAAWSPPVHRPADALRRAAAPLGTWVLLLAPLTIALELVSRLLVGWWRLTVPAVRFLNRHVLLWPVAIPVVVVGHLFLASIAGAILGQWMPGVIGGGHAVAARSRRTWSCSSGPWPWSGCPAGGRATSRP